MTPFLGIYIFAGIPLLDIETDFGVPSQLVANLLPVRNDLEVRITKNHIHTSSNKDRLLELYNVKMKLMKEADNCLNKAKDSQAGTVSSLNTPSNTILVAANSSAVVNSHENLPFGASTFSAVIKSSLRNTLFIFFNCSFIATA